MSPAPWAEKLELAIISGVGDDGAEETEGCEILERSNTNGCNFQIVFMARLKGEST
jgi:hypothetical protein